MGAAFTTSIWGMILSIIFTLIYKYKQAKISKKINELCLLLDSENKIELQDLEVIQAEKQKAVIHELFMELKDNETPAVVECIVTDIDAIVRIVRFPGWQKTSSGEREVQKSLRKALLKYKLHKD